MASKPINVILITDRGWFFGRRVLKCVMLLFILLLLLSALYYTLVLHTRFLLRSRTCPARPARFFSVIIAARNESARVLPLIASLRRLDYDEALREIIFVDDGSADDTAALIEREITTLPGARLIRLRESDRVLPGKKNALHTAIMQASGAFIAVTDADCSVPPGWLATLNNCFDTDDIMTLGHATIGVQSGLINLYLRFDNLFAGIMTAVPAMLGLPLSSVGRNMAYRREAYLQSGGYPELARHRSGDDVFLTELFRKKVKGHIRFCGGAGSYVRTRAPETLREILWQQIRKNSKLIRKSPPALALTFFLLAFHLLLLYMLFWPGYALPALALLAAKFVLEFLALWRACDFFDAPELKKALPFFQLIYPPLVVVLALAGLTGLYKWKP